MIVGAIDWDITVEPSDQITIESQVDHSEDINWDIGAWHLFLQELKDFVEVNEEGMEFGAIESRSSDGFKLNSSAQLILTRHTKQSESPCHEAVPQGCYK